MNRIDNFALIIGSMKSGTTSLFEYLSQHPQISSCVHKEPNFYAFDRHWNKGFEWYLKLWQDWDNQCHKIALEASTNYTKKHLYPHTAERIKLIENKYKIKFKFIYLVRDPIQRIESHYTYSMTTNHSIGFKKFSEGIDEDLIETSKYAQQISVFNQFFMNEQILILKFDDLKINPDKVMTQICQFLEIDSDYQFQSLNTVYNSSKARIIDVPWWIRLKRIKLAKNVSTILSSQQKKKLRLLVGGQKNKP
ncbi:MAG: sulfotransferase [Hydrococcus sp. SU_1_0]|nr:sulfotransferase [Hydrococcus sp. SU_1_0]